MQANGFLYHMVRNIVGALVRVGAGEAEPGWMAELLACRRPPRWAPQRRHRRACTSPTVHYPAELGIARRRPRMPVWRDR